jgi:nucleoside-diphosphate-sugar epimerase
MTRIAVTGATGFIGRFAVAALIAAGHEVVGVSRKTPSGKTPGVQSIPADLLGPDFNGARLSRDLGCDALLHLAWVTEHGSFWDSPDNALWAAASERLARGFVAGGGSRIVAAGTCVEYDPPASGACDPLSTPIAPRHPYGKAKDRFHRALDDLGRATGAEIAWGRIFLLIGPGEDKRRLVPSVIRSLLANEKAKCSSGKQIRDFMDVRDCAAGFAALALSDATGAFDVCSGKPTTIGALVSRLGILLNQPGLVALGALPDRPGEPPNLVGTPSRLLKETGFTPRYDLDRTLADAIAWWRSQPGT